MRGSNESEFRYNIKNFVGDEKIAHNFYKLKYNNTAAVASELLSVELKDIIASTIRTAIKVVEVVSKQVKKAAGDIHDDITGKKRKKDRIIPDAAKGLFDRYREDLKAAISVDTGLPSGSWHVMIGDPKNPFVSCGDLVVDDKSAVKFGKELGPGGFPTSFSVTYNLTQARPRGRQEIMRIFNGGRGRVYTYKAVEDNPDYGIFK